MTPAVKLVDVTISGGTVSHWLRTIPTWRPGEEGRTLCGKRARLLIGYTGLPTCASCERELRRSES